MSITIIDDTGRTIGTGDDINLARLNAIENGFSRAIWGLQLRSSSEAFVAFVMNIISMILVCVCVIYQSLSLVSVTNGIPYWALNIILYMVWARVGFDTFINAWAATREKTAG